MHTFGDARGHLDGGLLAVLMLQQQLTQLGLDLHAVQILLEQFLGAPSEIGGPRDLDHLTEVLPERLRLLGDKVDLVGALVEPLLICVKLGRKPLLVPSCWHSVPSNPPCER